MVLDIKIIRNNPEEVKESIKKRGLKVDIENFLELDEKIIGIKKELDEKRALKNKVSKEIPQLQENEKKEKIAEMKNL